MATAETDQGENLQRSKHAKRWTRWLNKNEISWNSFFLTASEKVIVYCKQKAVRGAERGHCRQTERQKDEETNLKITH